MIRKYKQEDISSIVELEKSTLGESLGEEMLQTDLDNEMQSCYVYENDGLILGYISCVFDGFAVEIINFCVQANVQNQRIGTKILDFIINTYYSLGATNVILDVRESNARAIHLYEKFGFKKIRVRKQYYKNNENAFVYQKLFNPIEDIEDAYLQIFCKFEATEGYTRILDLDNPNKYHHNFTRLRSDNEAIIERVLSEYYGKNFIQLNSYQKLDNPILKDLEQEHNAIYHANLAYLQVSSKNNTGKVHIASVEDKDKLYSLLFENNKEYGFSYSDRNTKQVIDASINKKKITVFVVQDDVGNYVGSLHVFIYRDSALLEDFKVLSEHQNKGYETKLLEYAFDYLRQQGCYDVILCADEEDTPKDMYQKIGFYKSLDCFIYRKYFK